jgi:hypothetical protein
MSNRDNELLSILSINLSILLISFSLRIESYKETTYRKIKSIIDININDDDSQFMLETKEKNKYKSFQSEKYYAFAH